jgi:hypothetical protein
MVGWNYRLVGAPDPIVTANLRWLAGYRHPRHDLPDVGEVLRRVFVTPTPLMAGRGLWRGVSSNLRFGWPSGSAGVMSMGRSRSFSYAGDRAVAKE